MAEEGAQNIDTIGVGLDLNTSRFDSRLEAASAKLAAFETERSSALKAPRTVAISPQFNVNQRQVRALKVDINQHLSSMAARNEAVAVPVKLGQSDWAGMRSQISQKIGSVPITVHLAGQQGGLSKSAVQGGVAGGQGSPLQVLRAIESWISVSQGTSLPDAHNRVRRAASSRGVNVPGMARGGHVASGRPYIVGEEGAEVFVPTTSGTIIPNRTSFPRGVPTSQTLSRASSMVRSSGGPVQDKSLGDWLNRMDRDAPISKQRRNRQPGDWWIDHSGLWHDRNTPDGRKAYEIDKSLKQRARGGGVRRPDPWAGWDKPAPPNPNPIPYQYPDDYQPGRGPTYYEHHKWGRLPKTPSRDPYWEDHNRAQGGAAKRGGLPRGYKMEFYGRTGEPGHMLGAGWPTAGWNPEADRSYGWGTMPEGVSNFARLQKPVMRGNNWPGGFSAVIRDRQGRVVGMSPFDTAQEDGRNFITPRATWVHPGHRNKGLANAMYVRAEHWSGATARPDWSQSKEGEALWDQPNRPFGKGQSPRRTVTPREPVTSVNERGQTVIHLDTRNAQWVSSPLQQRSRGGMVNQYRIGPTGEWDEVRNIGGMTDRVLDQIANYQTHAGPGGYVGVAPTRHGGNVVQLHAADGTIESWRMFAKKRMQNGGGVKRRPVGVHFEYDDNASGSVDASSRIASVKATRKARGKGYRQNLGEAYFEQSERLGGWYPTSVAVRPKVAGQGIGSWLYATAEEHLGDFIHPSDVQSRYAQRMWTDPRRPFGGDPDAVPGQMPMFYKARRWPHRVDGGPTRAATKTSPALALSSAWRPKTVASVVKLSAQDLFGSVMEPRIKSQYEQQIHGYQPEYLKEISQSMLSEGQHEPVDVRIVDGKPIIYDGNHRVASALDVPGLKNLFATISGNRMYGNPFIQPKDIGLKKRRADGGEVWKNLLQASQLKTRRMARRAASQYQKRYRGFMDSDLFMGGWGETASNRLPEAELSERFAGTPSGIESLLERMGPRPRRSETETRNRLWGRPHIRGASDVQHETREDQLREDPFIPPAFRGGDPRAMRNALRILRQTLRTSHAHQKESGVIGTWEDIERGLKFLPKKMAFPPQTRPWGLPLHEATGGPKDLDFRAVNQYTHLDKLRVANSDVMVNSPGIDYRDPTEFTEAGYKTIHGMLKGRGNARGGRVRGAMSGARAAAIRHLLGTETAAVEEDQPVFGDTPYTAFFWVGKNKIERYGTNAQHGKWARDIEAKTGIVPQSASHARKRRGQMALGGAIRAIRMGERTESEQSLIAAHPRGGVAGIQYTRNLRAKAAQLRPHHIEGGKAWYAEAQNWVEETAAKYGKPVDTVRGMTAALSAGTAWSANKFKVNRILEAEKKGEEFPYDIEGYLNDPTQIVKGKKGKPDRNVFHYAPFMSGLVGKVGRRAQHALGLRKRPLDAHVKAYKMLYGEVDPKSLLAHTPKTGNFYKNLAGDLSAVTIDRWALRSATRGLIDRITKGPQRAKIERSFFKVARENGMEPAEFQAAIWLLEKEQDIIRRRELAGREGVVTPREMEKMRGHYVPVAADKEFSRGGFMGGAWKGRLRLPGIKTGWSLGPRDTLPFFPSQPLPESNINRVATTSELAHVEVMRAMSIKNIESDKINDLLRPAGLEAFGGIRDERTALERSQQEAAIEAHAAERQETIRKAYNKDRKRAFRQLSSGEAMQKADLGWLALYKSSDSPRGLFKWPEGMRRAPNKRHAFGYVEDFSEGSSDLEDAWDYEEKRSRFGIIDPKDWSKNALGGHIRGASRGTATRAALESSLIAHRMTLENEGGTFAALPGMPVGQPSKGYAVSIPPAGGTAAYVNDPKSFREFHRAFQSVGQMAEEMGAPYVGTWLSKGRIHVDPSIVARSKRDADIVGRAKRQEASFDLQRFKEIPITGKSRASFARIQEIIATGMPSRGNVERVRVKTLLGMRREDREAYPRSGQGATSLDDLTANIAAHGFEDPVTIGYNPNFHSASLHDGNHRLAAALRLGLKTIPAQLRSVISPKRYFKDVSLEGDPVALEHRAFYPPSKVGIRNRGGFAGAATRGVGDWGITRHGYRHTGKTGDLYSAMQSRLGRDFAGPPMGKEALDEGLLYMLAQAPRHPEDLNLGQMWRVMMDPRRQGGEKWLPSKSSLTWMVPHNLPSNMPLSPFPKTSKIKAHAAGGREDGNGTYLVGELAPELFVPDRMRYIIPENVMDKIPKRGGGGRAKPAFLGALIGPLMGALGGAMGGMAGLASMAGGALQQVAGSVMGSLFGGQNADYGGFAKGGHIRKMGGGVIEVGSRGPHLFTPPEDGWIVPHNLTGQVSPNIPRAVAGVGIRLSKAERDALKVRRNQKADPEDIRDWTEEQGDILNMVAEGNIGAIQALSGRNTKSWLASMATSGTRQGFMQRQHAAQISIGEARRTARREAPTILLGQDAERRRADAETALTRMTARRSELETKRASMEARGATAMVTPAGNATEYAKTVRTIGALTSGMEKANKVIGAHTKVVDEGRASLVKVNEANQTAAQLSKQAQPGAVAKAGMGGQVFAANIAYQVAMQAFSAVISAATPQAEKWVDSVTGFTATNQRVTKKIGESVRQTGGNLQTAMGQLALSSGLSGGAMEFLKGALGGASFAKAGAAAQTEKSDLFKAAANGNAPTGLVGGYGGLFGTGILGEFMGGGKGYAEQMGLDIKDFAGKAATAELVAGGPNGMTTPASGYGSMDWMSGTFGPAFVAQMKENVVASGGSITQAPRNPEQEKAFKALTEYTNDFNESLKRGATAAGEVAYTFTKVGEAIDPKDLEAFKALGDEAKDMAAANQVLVNAQGEVVSTQKEFQAALAQGARGNAIGSPEAYAASQTMGIMGQFKGMAAQIGHALAISIPAQFGQQLAAQPFLAAQTGVYSPGAEKTLAGSSKVVGDLLAGAKVIQDELTAAGDQAVEAQAKWIDEQATFNPELQAKPAAAYHRYEGKALPDGDRVMGGGAIKSVADQYREAMASVKESGIAIAKYQTLIADTQLKVAEKSYANNLRLSNRAVSDARGLAGLTGGANNLGAVQRQQTMLGFGMQQKQINFSVAMAGFQAPGLTSEERGARQEQAKIEAAYAQKQLNLSKQAFGIEAGRGVTDTSASRAVMKAEWEAQKVTAAANKAIAAEQMKIAKNLAVAEKHVAHAEGTFAAIINSAVGYVSVFGSTIGQATTAIRTALGMTAVNTRTGRPLRGTGSASGHSATTEATGMIGSFSTPTTATFGEAGTETVAILRNPRQAMMGAMGGGYAAPAPTIVTLNLTVQGDVQGEAVVAKIVRAVEDSFNRKAARLGMRTYVSAAG